MIEVGRQLTVAFHHGYDGANQRANECWNSRVLLLGLNMRR